MCGRLHYKISISVLQFSVICDREYLTMITEMIYMAIVGVGTVVGSYLGDK